MPIARRAHHIIIIRWFLRIPRLRRQRRKLLGGDLGTTILYGIVVSIPVAIFGGMMYGSWIAKRIYVEVPAIAATNQRHDVEHAPPVAIVILLLLLPILLIFGATVANLRHVPFQGAAVFLGHPFTALTITALVAIYFFGIRRGVTRDGAMKLAAESLAPMGALLCIMGGGGAYKQIIVDTGVGAYMGKMLATSPISPLVVVFIVAAALRLAQELGDGRDHHRGPVSSPHYCEGHSRLSARYDRAGTVLRRLRLLARLGFRVLAGEPILRHERRRNAQIVDRHENPVLLPGPWNCASDASLPAIDWDLDREET